VSSEWSDDDLVAQVVIFLFAGLEAVSSVIAFALYELALHPEVQDRLVQEIRKLDVETNGLLDYNTLQRMDYMEMVLSGKSSINSTI
jgi:cytochrome P450